SRAGRSAGQQRWHYPRCHVSSHEARTMDGRHQYESRFAVQHVPAAHRRHARPQVRSHHQYLFDQWPEGPDGANELLGRKSWRARLYKGLGPGRGTIRHYGKRNLPGYINTEMVQAVPKDVLEKSILPQIPIGRLGEPEEIARCVVFLA